MKKEGVFRLKDGCRPVPGCTVSGRIFSEEPEVLVFSLGEKTDISAEIYPAGKLYFVLDGQIIMSDREAFCSRALLHPGDAYFRRKEALAGVEAVTDSVYLEISVEKEKNMNQMVKAGEIFKLGDLVPYQKDRIVNMDVIGDPHVKLVVMSFDEGQTLSRHAARGEAILFGLEGEGIVEYEGKEYTLHAGENFHFAKGGMHSVKAVKKFKMALILTLEQN